MGARRQIDVRKARQKIVLEMVVGNRLKESIRERKSELSKMALCIFILYISKTLFIS